MIGEMPAVEEYVSDALSRLTKEQKEDQSIVESCEYNAKLVYYQTFLAHTDYIPLKIVEGAATADEYTDELKRRHKAREQINKLMKPLE